MNKVIGLALLAGGIALIVYGIDASHATLSRTFNATPTDKTMWLLLCGIGASTAGFILTLIPSRR